MSDHAITCPDCGVRLRAGVTSDGQIVHWHAGRRVTLCDRCYTAADAVTTGGDNMDAKTNKTTNETTDETTPKTRRRGPSPRRYYVIGTDGSVNEYAPGDLENAVRDLEERGGKFWRGYIEPAEIRTRYSVE